MPVVLKQRSVLPGFGLTLGYTLLYLSLIVLIPLSALFLKTASADLGARSGRRSVSRRVVASYQLTFGASLAGGGGQRGLRPGRGLGAGALSVSRQAAWSTPWSICRSPCPRPWPASR